MSPNNLIMTLKSRLRFLRSFLSLMSWIRQIKKMKMRMLSSFLTQHYMMIFLRLDNSLRQRESSLSKTLTSLSLKKIEI